MRKLIMLAAGAATSIAAPAAATETITYSYDAQGRLVEVERAGTVNNGVDTTYQYDDADNRTNKTTTGSPNPGPP
jgi:YD repeat-containing protein